MTLLNVNNLSVSFNAFKAVDQLSLSVSEGEVVGVVGESGSGKSVMSMAMMGLLDTQAKVEFEAFHLDKRDMLLLSSKKRREMMGKDISMIFQDALTSLNPCYSVGAQIVEALTTHEKITKKKAKEKALDLLETVGIPDPKKRIDNYPHQLSGGMCQRVMIAMALACKPKLLIADEPTTALDVTIQAQVIELLLTLQKQYQMGMILITHDLALVSEVADKIVVMYAGKVVESGTVDEVFHTPKHPYTQALLRSLPEFGESGKRLYALEGVVPGANDRPNGCLFSPRCQYANLECQRKPELKTQDAREVLCHFPLNHYGSPVYE